MANPLGLPLARPQRVSNLCGAKTHTFLQVAQGCRRLEPSPRGNTREGFSTTQRNVGKDRGIV